MVIKGLRARVAAVVAVATFAVLAGTGAAYGFWTTTQQSVSGSATAASLSISVTGDLTTTYAFSGTGSGTTTPAGASLITREAVITNSGTSTINLATSLKATRAASSTIPAADVAFWMWLKGSASTCTGTSGTQTTLASPVTIAGATLAPGATQSVCIATRLQTTVAQNTGKTLTVTLDATGTHTSGWQAAAAVASTQTVYSVAKPSVQCADNDGNGGYGLDLNYTVPSGQTYDVYKSADNGATYQLLQANAPSGQLYTATNLGGGTVVGTGVEYLRVTANGLYGVTTVGNPIPIRYASVFFGINTIRCNPEGTY